ncbi:MAG: glycosyltransferase family 2 protein [Weeksellaceae bacterium]|nr:glycosyltransferase family 2 protein [Weeksellaceae bacterium]
MTQLPIFSVILTSFNGAENLGQVVNSIMTQKGVDELFHIELIAIDDASSDSSVEILEEFPLILLQNKKNSGGPNLGRNRGLAIATGKYLCIADQDDVWYPNRLKEILPVIQKVPIVSSGYDIYDTKTGDSRSQNLEVQDAVVFFEKNETFRNKLQRNWDGQNTYLGSLFFWNELIGNRFEEEFGQVDFDWILRMFHEQESAEITQALYKRIIHGANLSMNENYRKRDYQISAKAISSYASEYRAETEIGLKSLNGSMARYYYLMGDMQKARKFFKKAKWDWKVLMFYLTSYFGHQLIRSKVHFYG